jgi:hypothetical protein
MPTLRTIEETVAMMRLAYEVHRQCKYHFDTTPTDIYTILSVNQKFDETGTIEDLPRSGRPLNILSEETLEEIEEMVTNKPQLTIRQGAAQADAISILMFLIIKSRSLHFYQSNVCSTT